MKTLIKALLSGVALLGLLACGPKEANNTKAVSVPANTTTQSVFTILAGTELKDIESEVVAFGAKNGINVKFEYTGTLEVSEKVADNPTAYDALWVSHGKYILSSEIKGQIVKSDKTMYSKVVIGVLSNKAAELGLKSGTTGWQDIVRLSKSQKLSYAMTNPTSSNTGFVALVGLAAELSNKGDALEVKDIPSAELTSFFTGQKLTAGSSGTLADLWKKSNGRIDAMINYESIFRSLQKEGVKVDVIIPKEGVITADYPLMLVNKAKTKEYDQLISWVRSDNFQNGAVVATGRDPLKGSQQNAAFVNELPFPANIVVIDKILEGFINEYSIPLTTIFVLDVSGSMEKAGRMDAMKSMMLSLTDSSRASSKYAGIRKKEKVIVQTFDDKVYPLSTFEWKNSKQSEFEGTINGLRPIGGTAIFNALDSAMKLALTEKKKDRRVSIVLLTDGENKSGMSLKDFFDNFSNQEILVPVFPISYGEANSAELESLAKRTSGKMFDGKSASLSKVMKEIRGWQ